MHYPLLLIILSLIVAGNQGRHLEKNMPAMREKECTQIAKYT